jgi:hypothetical protein
MNPLVPALVSVLGVGGVMGLVAGLRRVPVATAAPKPPRLLPRLATVPRGVLVSGLLAAGAGVLVPGCLADAIVLFPGGDRPTPPGRRTVPRLSASKAQRADTQPGPA